MANVTITLGVVTDNFQCEDRNAMCTLSQEGGEGLLCDSPDPGTCTSYVWDTDSEVIWKGVNLSPNSDAIVNILRIEQVNIGNPVLGNSETITGGDGTGEQCKSQIIDNTPNAKETYRIFFNINGVNPCHIDPKITIHSSNNNPSK